MLTALARPVRFAAVAAIPVLLAFSPIPTGGSTYEFVVRTQSSTSGNKEMVTMRGRGTVAGENSRIEILDAAADGGGMFGGKGSYFLVLGGGKEMMLVDPGQKTYMAWDMGSMLAGMSKLVNAVGGLVKMEMSDIKIEATSMGAGETVQGHATTHVRMTENYTMSAKMFGRSSKSRVETTTDYYFAPALKNIANPFVQNSQALAASFDVFNNPDYKQQMLAAQAKLQGVPIKVVSRSVTTDEGGKQQVSVTTTEMLNFKNLDVPASAFAIPAGYQKIEMPKLDASLAAGADGAEGPMLNADSLATAAKQGASDAAKDEAKKAGAEAAKGAAAAAKGKIKGIFKR